MWARLSSFSTCCLQKFQGLEARRSQAGVTLDLATSLLSVAMWASILAMACACGVR